MKIEMSWEYDGINEDE
jgi:hypothetical protein